MRVMLAPMPRSQPIIWSLSSFPLSSFPQSNWPIILWGFIQGREKRVKLTRQCESTWSRAANRVHNASQVWIHLICQPQKALFSFVMGVMNVVVQKECEDVFTVRIHVPRRFLLLSKDFEHLKFSPHCSTQQWFPLEITCSFWDSNWVDPEQVGFHIKTKHSPISQQGLNMSSPAIIYCILQQREYPYGCPCWYLKNHHCEQMKSNDIWKVCESVHKHPSVVKLTSYCGMDRIKSWNSFVTSFSFSIKRASLWSPDTIESSVINPWVPVGTFWFPSWAFSGWIITTLGPAHLPPHQAAVDFGNHPLYGWVRFHSKPPPFSWNVLQLLSIVKLTVSCFSCVIN